MPIKNQIVDIWHECFWASLSLPHTISISLRKTWPRSLIFIAHLSTKNKCNDKYILNRGGPGRGWHLVAGRYSQEFMRSYNSSLIPHSKFLFSKLSTPSKWCLWYQSSIAKRLLLNFLECTEEGPCYLPYWMSNKVYLKKVNRFSSGRRLLLGRFYRSVTTWDSN